MEIAERCNLKLKPVDNPFPEFAVPEGHTIDSYFRGGLPGGIQEAAGDGGAAAGAARSAAARARMSTRRGSN
jgi:DNA polymerase III alpha subunit